MGCWRSRCLSSTNALRKDRLREERIAVTNLPTRISCKGPSWSSWHNNFRPTQICSYGKRAICAMRPWCRNYCTRFPWYFACASTRGIPVVWIKREILAERDSLSAACAKTICHVVWPECHRWTSADSSSWVASLWIHHVLSLVIDRTKQRCDPENTVDGIRP